jgi:hypothetical protein
MAVWPTPEARARGVSDARISRQLTAQQPPAREAKGCCEFSPERYLIRLMMLNIGM